MKINNTNSFFVSLCIIVYIKVSNGQDLVDCSIVEHSTRQTIDLVSCICLPNFIWVKPLDACIKNCTSDPNAIPGNTTLSTQCNCKTNFIWDDGSSLCVKNCSSISHS